MEEEVREEEHEAESPQVEKVNQRKRRSPRNISRRHKKNGAELISETKSGDHEEQSGGIFIIAAGHFVYD